MAPHGFKCFTSPARGPADGPANHHECIAFAYRPLVKISGGTLGFSGSQIYFPPLIFSATCFFPPLIFISADPRILTTSARAARRGCFCGFQEYFIVKMRRICGFRHLYCFATYIASPLIFIFADPRFSRGPAEMDFRYLFCFATYFRERPVRVPNPAPV